MRYQRVRRESLDMLFFGSLVIMFVSETQTQGL